MKGLLWRRRDYCPRMTFRKMFGFSLSTQRALLKPGYSRILTKANCWNKFFVLD